jgi:polyisoprenoid-binding protein YceI
MSKRWLLVGVAAVVVAFGGAYGVLALARRDTPPPAGFSPTPTAAASASANENPEDLDGEWSVVASNSFVGYRVRERLTFLSAPSDAVGRTSSVKGTLRIAGPAVETVDVTADLRQLKSDEDRRDRRMHTLGLESDRFPTTRFQLSTPMQFESKPAAGETVKASASGKLTIHGVTRDVTIPLEARWNTDGIEVVGSQEIAMRDYNITPPKVGPVLSISDKGTIEFELRFVRA